jgi:hypothetical protein
VVLTPHLTSPENTIEGVMDNEISCLKHGVYNLGFVGVKADDEGRRFAKWWGDRIYHFCRDDIPHGLFTDQRWIDLVPVFFDDVGILKTPRLNVATWNLRTRKFAGSMADGFTVDGFPLGFYHFTGFDSGAHRAMATRNADGNDAVQELIGWYTAQTDALANDPLAQVKWAYSNYSDGVAITTAQRLVYRDRADLQAVFPDPYDPRGFRRWWEQHAAIEYPELFDPARADLALTRLTKVLSPGFHPKPVALAPADLDAIPQAAQTPPEPVYSYPPPPAAFWIRAWRLLRREGISGVLRRLR